jgi:adenylate cyclase
VSPRSAAPAHPLIDTTNAAHVWAERYDRALDDIFALQDELTISVIGAIEPSLRQAEIERARRKRPDSLDAYDLYLRALPDVFTRTPESADKALDPLQRSVAIDPDYAAAHAAIAWAHHARYLRRGRQEPEKRAALQHARIAVATGGDDSTALGITAFVIGILDQDYETSVNTFDRALALSPSSSLALGFGSIIRAWVGHDAIAMENAEQALRLSPFDPLIFMPYVGFYPGRFL